MSIPVLNELSSELTRIYAAGARLAKGDPRLKKYIQPLEALGQKAPVFAALSKKLGELVDGEEKTAPENLMELGTLLHSVLYTQGSTATGAPLSCAAYSEKPLAVAQMPYSQLHALVELLESGSQQHTPLIDEAYKCGTYNDPRLYEAYITAVTENKTYLSNYVCETILPAIGQDIAPFIERALNIGGERRDARLFKALYQIKGRAILPLSEAVLQDGSRTVLTEAIYTLGEDAKYEQTLLAYAKDRKGDVRQAAFAALTKLGSAQGDALLLEELGKANIGSAFDALCQTQNPQILEQVYAQTHACAKSPKEHKNKLILLLQALARRDEAEGLRVLRQYVGDKDFYETNTMRLDLNVVMQSLIAANTPEKNELTLQISEDISALDAYKIRACVRLFSPEEVYKRCRETVRSGYVCAGALQEAYGMPQTETCGVNGPKPWDRRWAEKMLDAGMILQCAQTVYDDDTHTWKKLLDACADQIKKQQSLYHRIYYAGILNRAFALGHPFAKKYYEKFIKAGFPKEDLDAKLTITEE